jgi:hypothetical protein
MARSGAKTVQEYLAELAPDRRAVVAAVRKLVLDNLPAGYREGMNWGMIVYEVPLDVYPDTYNRQPLCYAAVAAQKNLYALYLTCCTGPDREARLRAAFAAAGKKLDMGKSCIRFKSLAALELDAIAREIAGTPMAEFIAGYEAVKKT